MNISHRYEGVRVGIKDMDWKFEVSEGLVVYIEFLGGVGCCSRCERTRRIRIVRPGRHLQFGIIFLLSDMNTTLSPCNRRFALEEAWRLHCR